jgi:UDP:flavonoid glycosyltransferase YjiC (YdhE family)
VSHFILTSLGTDGDVYPFLGLGAELLRRGNRITAVLGDQYQPLAEQNGFEFASLVPAEETERLLAHPDFWHPLKAARIVSQWGLGYVRQQCELLAQLASTPDSVIVASPGVPAARIVQEKHRIPTASVLLQPGLIPSSIEPPVMPGGLTLPRWAPAPLKWLYWRGLDFAGDRLVGRHLNVIRAEHNLAPMRRMFRWWLSPELVIGLFPAWYGAPQRDWPPQLKLAGFPLYDGRPATEIDSNLEDFLQAGSPPIAFTFGTGMMHAALHFRAAVEACSALDRRGLLLTRYQRQLPADLPARIRSVDYAPFNKLFPRCAAVVHHGGVGTTVKAMLAGTPQLVVPFAYDQNDNAARVKRLGVGDWLSPRRMTAQRLAGALSALLEPAAGERCQPLSTRLQSEPCALRTAATLLTAFAQSSGCCQGP